MYISKKFWTGPFEQTPWARVKRSILKPFYTRTRARGPILIFRAERVGLFKRSCSKFLRIFMWIFIFYQAFLSNKCIRVCLQEEVFLFRVCKVFVTHEKFCMRILEQFSFLVAFSKTSQQRHGVPDRGITGNPGIRECQSTSTTVPRPAPAMQQFVPSQKTSFYNVSLNPRPSNLSIRWDTPPWNEQQKFWKSMVRRWHLIYGWHLSEIPA